MSPVLCVGDPSWQGLRGATTPPRARAAVTSSLWTRSDVISLHSCAAVSLLLTVEGGLSFCLLKCGWSIFVVVPGRMRRGHVVRVEKPRKRPEMCPVSLPTVCSFHVALRILRHESLSLLQRLEAARPLAVCSLSGVSRKGKNCCPEGTPPA